MNKNFITKKLMITIILTFLNLSLLNCSFYEFYVEVLCGTSNKDVDSIIYIIQTQNWYKKSKVIKNGDTFLLGPYDLETANIMKDKIIEELNLPCSIYVKNNNADIIDENTQETTTDTFYPYVEEDEIVISSSSKEISKDMLNTYSDENVVKIIKIALELYSVPYKWGGVDINKGIDCSFFVKYVFSKLGIELPRTSREQFKIGKPVDEKDLRCGDLVFFKKIKYRKIRGKLKRYEYINHVGIYLNNREFIHATRGSKKVTISSLDEPYYKKMYAGARRILKDDI